MNIVCPYCGEDDEQKIGGVEYGYSHPQRYDGVSEWCCMTCDTHWGRWTGKILAPGESETRYGRS